MKICSKCETAKPLSEFHKKGTGKASRCRSCCASLNFEYRKHNGEKIATKIKSWHDRNPHKKFEYHAKKYQTPQGRAMHLLNGAKKRLPEGFTLTLDHVVAAITSGFCPVTGVEFDLRINQNGKGARSFSPFAPSLDKIDARLPYTDENTRVVAWQYNVMKGELSDSDVLKICRIIVARAAQCPA